MKPDKKIVFVITHLELGGAQKLLLWLIKNLDSRYSMYLFSGNYGYMKKEFIDIPRLKIKFTPYFVRSVNLLYDLIIFLKLYIYIKKEKFDIIHTHSPKARILATWAAYFAGIRCVVNTVHGWSFHGFMSPVLYRFLVFIERITARHTEKIVVESRNDLKVGVEERIAPPGKFILIRHGVDIELLNKIFLARKNTLRDRGPVVNVSTFKRQKGLDSFLKMARLILDKKKSNLRFLLIGDGPLKRKIVKNIKRLNLDRYVELKGWVRDLSSILSTTSVLVLTSLWEGLPLIVLEALIAGVPVVATDTGGVTDVIMDQKNGIIVSNRDINKLSDAVLSVLSRYDEWQDRLIRNREDMNLSDWSIKRMVEEIENLYKELLDKF